MTTSVETAHFLERLATAKALCPEMRLGQLFATIGLLGEDATNHLLWDIEDDELSTALERFIADMSRRQGH